MKPEEELRSRIDTLPEWKKQWVKEAAAPLLREHFFAVTKPRWKEIDRRMKEVQEQTAVQAGFRDYAEVKRHVEWTRFGTPETAQLEAQVKRYQRLAEPRLDELMQQKNTIAAQQTSLNAAWLRIRPTCSTDTHVMPSGMSSRFSPTDI